MTAGELGEPDVEQRRRRPREPVRRRRTRASVGRDRGQRQARCRACARRPVSASSSRHLRRADLVELVHGAQCGLRVGSADPAVEALDQLAVVDLHRQRRNRQRSERVGDHSGDLDVVVERQRTRRRRVDVGLDELAVAALLRPLAPPAPLDLVALEREVQRARRSPGRSGRTGRSGRSAARVGVPPEPGSACSRRRTYTPCRSRPCAAAGRAARRRGSRAGRSRTARTCAAGGRAPTARAMR